MTTKTCLILHKDWKETSILKWKKIIQIIEVDVPITNWVDEVMGCQWPEVPIEDY